MTHFTEYCFISEDPENMVYLKIKVLLLKNKNLNKELI